MNEVQAVSNETTDAPKPNQVRHESENFVDILEKEKQKAAPPFFALTNLQQFSSVPLDLSSKTEEKLNRINTDSSIRRDLREMTDKTRSAAVKTPSKIESSEKNEISNENSQARIAQNKQTANAVAAVNKAIIGELELTSELYNAAIIAKNRSAELRSVDVDDLVSQIKDKIKFLKDTGKIELSMQLKPDNMGTIQMNITSSKGAISINILAGEQAKDALAQNMRELERSLKNANLNIANINLYSRENNGEYPA